MVEIGVLVEVVGDGKNESSTADGAGGAPWKSHCKKKNSYPLSKTPSSFESFFTFETGTTNTGYLTETVIIFWYRSSGTEAQIYPLPVPPEREA